MVRRDKDQDVRYFFGFPYRWQARNVFKDVWNKEDDRMFPPKHFGVGWSVNLHAVSKKLKIVKK